MHRELRAENGGKNDKASFTHTAWILKNRIGQEGLSHRPLDQ
jgi:hypothetical protein